MTLLQGLLLVVTPLFMLFAFVVLVGAPYFPSKRRNLDAVLKRLQLKTGQKVVDLGSGDGVVIKQFAEHQLLAIGVELNPLLVLLSRWRIRKHSHVEIIWKNMWEYRIPSDADYVYTFLHTRFMKRFDQKLQRELTQPTIVISFAFPIPEREVWFEEMGYFVYRYDIAKASVKK